MKGKGLFRYAVLPPILLNVWAILLYVPYYMLSYARPELVQGITPGQITFINYVFLMVVEWALALSVLRSLKREGIPLRRFLARDGRLFGFRPLPAIAAVVGVNLLGFAYFALANRLYGDTLADSYIGLAVWQRIFIIVVLPASAAFCEELIWRAYIPSRMEARRYGFWRIVVLSSLSFALIHGVFLVDKLVMTFLFGIILTVYVLKERNLVPAILGHWLMDLWSFGMFLFW